MSAVTATAAAAAAQQPVDSSYPGTVRAVGWKAGQGRVPNGGSAPYMGLYADVTINPSFRTTAQAKLKGNVITITLTAVRGVTNTIGSKKQELHVRSPNGMRIGDNYTVVVKDGSGNVLKTARNVSTKPAMAPRPH